jgi:hypothetical protein
MNTSQTPDQPETPVSRKRIFIRLLYTILFFLVLEIVKSIIQLATVVQYIFLFITLKPSQPVKNFCNRVAVYGYRIMRYLTLNEDAKPFPFTEFPAELEAPTTGVRFE